MAVSIKIILDTRRIKATNTYPVKLRVTHNRKTRDYPTIYDLSSKDFSKLKAPNISPELQRIRDNLRTIEQDALNMLKALDPFNFDKFNRLFITNHSSFKSKKTRAFDPLPVEERQELDLTEYYSRFEILKETHQDGYISGVFCAYIIQLLSENRIGTALKYRDSYHSLKKFAGNVRFKDITMNFLRSYEAWMLEKKRSKTTIGMVLRNLRAIFNEADAREIIKKANCYPFGRRKYQIPSSRKIKKALSLEDIGRIYYYKTSCENQELAKNLWLFCYFGNGMNPKDLLNLKFKNIHGEYLTFDRAKTILTSRTNPMPVTVYINEDMRNIIATFGNKPDDANNYIFPVLTSGLTSLQAYTTVTKFNRFMNDWTKKIGNNLGIECNLTSIISRHSFSTRLKRSGVSTEFIQESLGHADKRTTENYLDGFDNEIKKANAAKLLEFKNNN
jgi:integrase/recombinase XerD